MTSSSASASNQSHAEPDRASIGSILSDITTDVSTLMRQEVALAKAEAKQSATRASKGVGLFVGAAIAGLLVLIFLSVAVWWGLGNSTGRGWAGLIVAVIWAVIGGVLYLLGRAALKQISGLPQTTASVKQIPDAVKPHPDQAPINTGAGSGAGSYSVDAHQERS